MPYVDTESRAKFEGNIKDILDCLPIGVEPVIKVISRLVQSLLQSREEMLAQEPAWMMAADTLMWKLTKTTGNYVVPASSGDVNYCITRILDATICARPLRYSKINRAIGMLVALEVSWAPVGDFDQCDSYVEICGVLDCAKMEMYRKLAVNYEDKKCVENGEVYGPI